MFILYTSVGTWAICIALWYGGHIMGNEREEYGNYWLNGWQYCSTLMPPLILADNTRSQAYSVNFSFIYRLN